MANVVRVINVRINFIINFYRRLSFLSVKGAQNPMLVDPVARKPLNNTNAPFHSPSSPAANSSLSLRRKIDIVLSGVGMCVCLPSNTNTLVVCKVYVLSERVRIEEIQGGE